MSGLSSCGTRAQLLRGMWDLPGPGLESMSPALAVGFLTTAPPGTSLVLLFIMDDDDEKLHTSGRQRPETKCPQERQWREGHGLGPPPPTPPYSTTYLVRVTACTISLPLRKKTIGRVKKEMVLSLGFSKPQFSHL